MIPLTLLLLFFITRFQICLSQEDGSFWWLDKLTAKDSTITEPTTTVGGAFWWLDLIKPEEIKTVITTPSTIISVEQPKGKRNAEVVCCECVPFYLCVNGTINTDGAGQIDLRMGIPSTASPAVINVDVCPGDGTDVCCTPPDVSPTCIKKENSLPPLSSTTAKPPEFTPHPESSCDCVVYETCHPSLVVSNGLGNTSLQLSDGRMVSHSKCSHSLDVCCFLPELLPPDLFSSTPEGFVPTDECPQCVEGFLCGPDGNIITDGAGGIDLRIGGDIKAVPIKPCPYNDSLVCCHLKNHTEPPVVEPPEPTIPPESKSRLCGTRNYEGVGTRIAGFKHGQTQFGEFPWVVALLRFGGTIDDQTVHLFVGGASLIHRRMILTAAHKVADFVAEDLLVRLGEWDVSSTKETLLHQDILVEDVMIHPSFDPGSLRHDIALLLLQEDAQINFHISPICPASDLHNIVTDNCIVNGWGVDELRSANFQMIMKSVRLPLVDKGTCQTLLQKTRLSRYFRLHRTFICAGGEEGVDACQGDGGGPLACQLKDDPLRYVQVGITAWGIGCGTKNVPGVYVDVAVHHDWILECIHNLFPGEKYGLSDIVNPPAK